LLVIFAFLFVNLLDNASARLDFRKMVKFAWAVLIPMAALNVILLSLWQ